MLLCALALSGAVVVSAGAVAAQVERLPSVFQEAALVGPAPNLGTTGGQKDVIEPPSSVDPGMAIDPPQTGAKMPVFHPRMGPGGNMVLPR